jgi:ParB-like chromosome segregation protein Spo0J
LPSHPEFQAIKESVEVHGIIQPLVFSKTRGYIIGGAQRLTVLKELGIEEVPVVEVEFKDIAQEKAANMALNKITGRWDPDKLEKLKKEGVFSKFPTGFSMAEVDAIGKKATLPTQRPTTVDVGNLPKIYQVVVDCNNQAHQNEILALIKKNNWSARGIII